MRAYRLAYPVEGPARRLSQEGLLELMARVDDEYRRRYSHTTVVRWESGETLPDAERLEVFGKALELTPSEVEGLKRLASLDIEESRRKVQAAVPSETAETYRTPDDTASGVRDDLSSHARESFRFALSRFLPPASFMAVAGCLMLWLGLSAAWMMTLYVIVSAGAVLFQTLLRMRTAIELRDIIFASVFILLGTPMLQGPITHTETFGLSTIGFFMDIPKAYLLSLMVNLVSALAASLLFDFLRRWRSQGPDRKGNGYRRAALIVPPPLIFVYVCSHASESLGILLWASLIALVYMVIVTGAHLAFSAYRQEKRVAAGRAVTITTSLVLLIGVGGLALSDNAIVGIQQDDFDARSEDIWLVPTTSDSENPADIKTRFRNRSSFYGPYGGDATFDVSIVVQSPNGAAVRHQMDNQSFSYNEERVFTTEHAFDQAGIYTIHAEIYDVAGLKEEWDPSHRFDIRSETFTIAGPNGGS